MDQIAPLKNLLWKSCRKMFGLKPVRSRWYVVDENTGKWQLLFPQKHGSEECYLTFFL
jgi:hypothetical protein